MYVCMCISRFQVQGSCLFVTYTIIHVYVTHVYIYVYVYIYTCMYIHMYVYTVGTESIQTPLNFSLFVILQPFAKII